MPEAKERPVYCLWINDWLIDIFYDEAVAVKHAYEKMNCPEFRNEEWKSLSRWRWHCRQVARLEIEPRTIRAQ